jgi:hypothetical protein
MMSLPTYARRIGVDRSSMRLQPFSMINGNVAEAGVRLKRGNHQLALAQPMMKAAAIKTTDPAII